MKKNKLLALFGIGLIAVPNLFTLTGCNDTAKISPNKLCLQFNDYLEKTNETGEHQEMIDKWFSLSTEGKDINYSSLKNINGNIRVGMLDAVEPFGYVDNNKYTGLVVDMVTDFAKQYNYSVTFQAYNSIGSLIAAVTNDICDIGASSTTITEERSQAVLFSDPYLNDGTGFLIRKQDASVYTNMNSFAGKTVGILSGSLYGQMIQEQVPGVTVNEYASAAELCLAVETQTIAGAMSDESTLKFACLYHPELTMFTEHVIDNYLGLFFRKTTYTSFSELAGKNIGVFAPDHFTDKLSGLIDGATFKQYEYSDGSIIVNDLNKGVIDAATVHTDVARYESNDELRGFAIINEPVLSYKSSVVFPNTEDGKIFLNRLNTFSELQENKYLFNNLRRNWVNHLSTSELGVPDYKTLPATNGTLKIGLDAINAPYASVKDNVYSGIFVDYLTLFAQANGFAIDFYNCLTTDVQTLFEEGKINGYVDQQLLSQTSDYFIRTQPIGSSDVNLVVRDSYASKENIFETMAKNFKKTFIVDDRYKSFLSGVGTTLLITICSIVLGLVLGFGVFILLRTNSKVANVIYKIIEFIVSGTPAVVFLMIFYYIIFGGSNVSSTLVAIIAFGFIFMCSTVTMLKTGFGSIDKGQNEAAFTMGYSKTRTFTRILLPQAAKTFLPLLKGNIIEHIKATAIVGYIAIVDLTKAAEIIRSRTFDAFFSLIVTTLLYFAIEYLFILLLKLIPVDPKKRKTIGVLKGVEKHD